MADLDGEYENPQSVFSRLSDQRILFLTGDIESGMATRLVAHLLWLDSVGEEEITIYINSWGGNVNDALLILYDAMQQVSSPIKTVCLGEAYSAAAVILAAGTPGRRFAYPHAKVMIHSIQVYDIGGSQKEVEKESLRIKKNNNSLMEIISHHSGQPITKVKKDCLQDKYMTAHEALEYGLIDHVLLPHKKKQLKTKK